MSYDEVERGLPPVNIVSTPIWLRRMQEGPGRSPLESNNPDHETESNFSAESCPSAIPDHTQRDSIDAEPPDHRPPTPPRHHPSTQRYVIKDEDNEMRVFKVEDAGTLNNDTIPNKFYISGSAEYQRVVPSSRPRQCIRFILCIIPAIFFGLTLHFIKFKMSLFPFHITGLCVFQSILWTSLVICLVHRFGFKMYILQCFSCSNDGWKNWVDIMVLTIFATGAILLQLMAIVYLDITVALSIMFAPLVVVALIRHINRERLFPLELLFTSVLAYLGITLIAIPSLITQHTKYQNEMILGLGAAIGSMMLSIPACLVLERLRYNKVDDSVTATSLGLLGSVICVIMGVILGFSPGPDIELDPAVISAVVGFTLCGIVFLFVEARLRAGLQQRSSSSSSIRSVHLCRTRVAVFIYSGIWEIMKRAIGIEEFLAPSAFSIFGVILLILSYMLTVGFESWVERIKNMSAAAGDRKKTRESGSRRFHFVPWLFSKK